MATVGWAGSLSLQQMPWASFNKFTFLHFTQWPWGSFCFPIGHMHRECVLYPCLPTRAQELRKAIWRSSGLVNHEEKQVLRNDWSPYAEPRSSWQQKARVTKRLSWVQSCITDEFHSTMPSPLATQLGRGFYTCKLEHHHLTDSYVMSILTLNWTELWITTEAHLHVCLWRCFQKGWTEEGRPPLNVGGTACGLGSQTE